MRTEFVYSFLLLGGVIPVTVNAADVQTISSDVLASTDGSKVTYPVGKLVKGDYSFQASLLSKVYGVTIKIGGQTLNLGNNANAQSFEIKFTLTKETDVELELVSTDPGEPGAGFTVADAKVILNFDFAAAKEEWTSAINTKKTLNIPSYDYDDDVENADRKAADDLIKELNNIAETYEAYVAQELYKNDSNGSKPWGKIKALAEQIADHQNTQAYNNVNAAITAIKAKYNAAVAELEGALINQAAYLLEAALKDLNDDINLKITEATQASYASYTGKTAIADETNNKNLIPSEYDINTIVNKWKGQAETNQAAYDALHKVVTDLQASLDAVKYADNDAAIAAAFETERAAAQKAIDDINTKVETAKNSADQLTLNVNSDKTAAEAKISTLTGKVNTANKEYNANKATVAAIADVQKALNDAKEAVNKKKSKDGAYPDKDYYADYLKTQQDAIDKLTSDAAKAYKVDGTGTAHDYNSGLAAKTSPITTAINNYKTNAIAAVDKYDALMAALYNEDKDHPSYKDSDNPGYQVQLNAARNKVEGLAVYTADGYDYQTEFDLIQKRINEIKKKITEAMGKVGVEHWTAMLGIDADAAITSDIAALVNSYQADQNEYDAVLLATGMTNLSDKIDAFKKNDASKLGADVNTFLGVENVIDAAYNAIKDASDAIDANSETVDYTAKVGTTDNEWKLDAVAHAGGGRNLSSGGYTAVEQWGNGGSTGTTLVQTVTGLPNGKYTVELYAFAAQGGTAGSEEFVHVFANGKTTPVKVAAGNPQNFGAILEAENGFNVYTIKDVDVTNGTLRMGLAKDKGGTQWHGIQIKSLIANTASLIQNWGTEIADLNNQQTALETAANVVAAKVAKNGTDKAANQTNIDNLQAAMATFATTWKVGEDNSPLGNRGKADGSVTKEVKAINDALTELEGDSKNGGVDVTKVTNVDNTSKVDKTINGWKLKDINIPGQNYQNQSSFGFPMVEQWKGGDVSGTGIVFVQEVEGLENGIYDVVLQANAVDQRSGNPNKNREDIVEVFANDATAPVQVSGDGNAAVRECTLNNVIVSNGKLTMGLRKLEAGTNWHAIQIKSLTYHENTNADLAKYNTEYLALADRKKTLDTNAPKIKAEVEANTTANTAATKAVSDLQTAELATLKSLKNVTNDNAESTDAVAKKTDPTDWKVFETGLDADKTYTAKKQAIDDDIKAMSDAIAASNAAETLVKDWTNNSISVTKKVDDKDVTTTYSISGLTERINALKDEAAKESNNWEAYKALQDNNMSKLLPNNIFTKKVGNDLVAMTDAEITELCGAGAKPYYTGLKTQYIKDKANILTRMQKDLNDRKAVSTKSAFVNEITGLQTKVDAVQDDARANKEKYDEQVKAYQETQTLWNSTYTEIAATDHSSVVQDWLKELDEIQVTLTAATEAVEENYPKGESVAQAKDFAAIKAAINDVKARQGAGYEPQITADNKAAHESFMGYDKEDGTHVMGAIESAREAYQTAVRERALYSSTNDDIKEAIDAAAAKLDKVLYECPNKLAELTAEENAAYEAAISPAVFDVDPFNTQATQIEQDITKELDTFKDAVHEAINNNVWAPKELIYNDKVTAAETAIKDYSKDAQKDAFKDVKDIIEAGKAGVAGWMLSEVETAINALDKVVGKDDQENDILAIDAMLAADKDAAAEKDINAAKTAADKAYSDTKAYIESKTIADDVNNVKATELQNLEDAKDAADETLEDYPVEKWTFDNHDNIMPDLKNVVTVADAAKKAVDDAIKADVKNTNAYNDMVKAIELVEAKLAEAKAAAAPYKYETSFATDEERLDNLHEWADDAKANGDAVDDKQNLIDEANALSEDIEATLTTAFGIEKAGLAADITELKNQFNAYVAANGLDDTATAFKADIDALEKALGEAAIKDLDKPANGIQFDERVAATNALVKLQEDIANKETELLEANATGANAAVLADFNAQIAELEETASLEDYDDWVGQQKLNGKTLEEQITALNAQIADLKAAIQAEKNISFYKDQYQAEITAIKTALEPVAEAIAAYDKKFKDNAAAYTRLTGEINDLQDKIDAAKKKVGAYEYAANTHFNMIEQYYDYDNPELLTGGVQKTLNDAKATIETANGTKSLNENSVVANKAYIETEVQNYLDNSAYSELTNQRNNLSTRLTNAIDVYNHEGVNKYSPVLWARLIAEKNGINNEIVDLAKEIYMSSAVYEGSFDVWTSWYTNVNLVNGNYRYYYTLDSDDNRIDRVKTSDADYDSQINTVKAIREEIAALSTAVDNLQLLGDANEDGRVNVLDYQKVLNMILDPSLQPMYDEENPITPKFQTEEELFRNLDINQSGVIEVGDLTAIVNYILKQNWIYDNQNHSYAAVKGMVFDDNQSESLTMTSEMQQGVQRLAINLQNVEEYTAFQLDVLLPEGMTIIGQTLSDRAGQSHKLYSRVQQDGSVRLLASSVKGESFSGNEGAVLYIDVKTDANFKGGNVELLNILFSDVYAQTRAFELGANGEATGIDIMAAMQSLKQKVYDLGGRMMNGMKKGVNIIQGADGTTKKVLK